MEIVSFLGFSGAISEKVRSLLVEKRLDALNRGIEIVDQPAIFRGVASGHRFKRDTMADVGELKEERRNLTKLVVCNKTYFANCGEIFSFDGEFYPYAGDRTKYFEHALGRFRKTMVLDLEYLPLFLLRFEGIQYRMAMDTLSRNQLLNLSWYQVIDRMAGEIKHTRLILIDAERQPRSINDILDVTSLNFPGLIPHSKHEAGGGRSAKIADNQFVGSSELESRRFFREFVGEDQTKKTLQATVRAARELQIHESIIERMFKNHTDDIMKIKNMKHPNIDTSLL